MHLAKGGFLKYLSILLFTVISFETKAGLLLEPYLGFDFSVKGQTSNCCQDVSWLNLEVGGRGGYIFDTFMLGVDIDYKNMNPTYEYNGSQFDQDTAVTNYGLFAGWMWDKWALRLKYYFDSNWILRENGPYGYSGLTNSGNGFGIDAAFRFSNHISLNLELTRILYNYVQGIKVSGGARLETTDILVAISFPFDLVTR